MDLKSRKYQKNSKVEAVEMDAMRRSLCISRKDRVRNETIKQEMGIEGNIVQDIEKKQLTWYEHVKRISERLSNFKVATDRSMEKEKA